MKHKLWQHNQEELHDCLYYWNLSAGIPSVLCLKAVMGQEVWERTQGVVQTSCKFRYQTSRHFSNEIAGTVSFLWRALL